MPKVKLSENDPHQPRSSCVGVEGEKQPGLDSHWQEEPPGCNHWNCRLHQFPHFHFHRHIWRHCHHCHLCVQVPQMFYPVETDLTLSAGDVVAARCTMVNTRDRWSWLFLGTLLNFLVMLLYFRWLMFGEMFRTHDYIMTSYCWQQSLYVIEKVSMLLKAAHTTSHIDNLGERIDPSWCSHISDGGL